MLCQECQQRQASLHFTKIVNGQKTEVHLCEECAREKGETIQGTNSYSIHDLLSGILKFDKPLKDEASTSYTKAPKPLVCDNCGLSYERFVKTGRFGCTHCYEAFETKLDPIFKKVHSGNLRHYGKIPKRSGAQMQVQREIDEERLKLKESVAKEEFEKAASIRDYIKELEQQMKPKGEEG
ncbi:protein arginine kinase activator [Sinobaca qinghaiensis]|uniref:Protein arginine kinase activator n=1 Tax=Sinobaca qinghaiensis TaxID=342944 RepID=A0A419UTR6_9BACL|nr:UvrB/UvrC motif-containing protein [Sinobaca qinghaiensis]RKD67526.1 protein arginine kinase activator [Sinobaca qinghaiensis]